MSVPLTAALQQDVRESSFRHGRYVRLEQDTQKDYINLGEVMVFDEKGVNVAAGKTVTASSIASYSFGKNLVDGDINNWFTTNYLEYGWILIDLGGVFPITKITVVNRQDSYQARLVGTVVKILGVNNDPKDPVFTSDPLSAALEQAIFPTCTKPGWMMIDLNSATAVRSVTVTNKKDTCTLAGTVVELLNSDMNVVETSSPLDSNQVQTVTFQARYASGGKVTYSGEYKYHVFTSDGIFASTSSLTIDVFVVAGGGGGGGGGGGAGGVVWSTGMSFPASTSIVSVGKGGTGGGGGLTNSGIPQNGNNSSLGSLVTAIGGGAGAGEGRKMPETGGSGGGGMWDLTTTIPAVGTQGQGNAGGISIRAGYGGSGGGGGAGGVGTNSTHDGIDKGKGGLGGVGLYFPDFVQLDCGSPAGWFGGGGGGGANTSSTPVNGGGGTGGSGGGGNGSLANLAIGSPGIANTGGGGGGNDPEGNSSTNNGGSGIVIIRYKV
jgi:hypothetical protein